MGSESYGSAGIFNGQPAINTALILQPTGNPLIVSKGAKNLMPENPPHHACRE